MDSEEKQIIALMKEENDEAIVAVCKEIDWSKEQSSYVELAMQSACENTGNIETEYNIRLAQYKNWRSDRYILYQVVSLAIRLGKLDEADEFFAEYQNKYGLTDVAGTCCLDYELRSAEGASDDELIDILEDVYRAEADVNICTSSQSSIQEKIGKRHVY
jgi:hypothetical protein